MSTDYLEGCGMPGCCCIGASARQRKRGWRLAGRIRLGRLWLWQAFVGLE